ncbi:hypothetical protein EZS27_037088, partial [termite gut metagenome]
PPASANNAGYQQVTRLTPEFTPHNVKEGVWFLFPI